MAFLPLALVLLGSVFLASFLHNDKLKRFRGPTLASWSDLWLVWHAYATRNSPPFQEVHRKYGDVVRLGPNRLIFGTYAAVKDIFSVTKDLPKSDWYLGQSVSQKGKPVKTHFATTDTEYHDRIRRAVVSSYSRRALVDYEPLIDTVTSEFVRQIETRFANREDGVFDIALWSNFYALDTISRIAIGQSYGFLKSGGDVMNLMADTRFFMKYAGLVSFSPALDHLLLKNPVLSLLNQYGIAEPEGKTMAHFGAMQREKTERLANGESLPPDMLNHFLHARDETFDDLEVSKAGIAIILAGGDTTASLTAAVFYYLLKHPRVYSRLLEEIDSRSSFSYLHPEGAPYLDAVIKETSRHFAVTRLNPERVTPPQGMVIDGREIPGNTKVGASPWVVQRDPAIWGSDADLFRPERWLVGSEAYKAMANKLFLFGMGKYQCLGIHIGQAEIYKVVPAFLKAFEVEQMDPDKEWKWEIGEIIYPYDILVRVTSRGKQAA